MTTIARILKRLHLYLFTFLSNIPYFTVLPMDSKEMYLFISLCVMRPPSFLQESTYQCASYVGVNCVKYSPSATVVRHTDIAHNHMYIHVHLHAARQFSFPLCHRLRCPDIVLPLSR